MSCLEFVLRDPNGPCGEGMLGLGFNWEILCLGWGACPQVCSGGPRQGTAGSTVSDSSVRDGSSPALWPHSPLVQAPQIGTNVCRGRGQTEGMILKALQGREDPRDSAEVDVGNLQGKVPRGLKD